MEENKTTCSHCDKDCDETKCVKDEDKKFCCPDCQKDHKDEKTPNKSENVCKFC